MRTIRDGEVDAPSYNRGAADERARWEPVATAARGALESLFGLIDSGWLVRDTTRDNEPGWAMTALEPVRKLATARAALSALAAVLAPSAASEEATDAL